MRGVSDVRDTATREGRVVTATFADLVGSTSLAERLDPEDFKLVVNDALPRVIGAVEAYGGTVKDLAGDGVLAIRRRLAREMREPTRTRIRSTKISA
jgi:class 3 adenylate cyclase